MININFPFSKEAGMGKTAHDRRGSALLMTILVLIAVLASALSVAAIIRNSLNVNRTQADSTKAYFAAEAGAERILYEVRKDSFDPLTSCTNPAKFCFNSSSPDSAIAECTTACNGSESATTTLSNGAEYTINYSYQVNGPESTTTLDSIGIYKDLRRKIELQY